MAVGKGKRHQKPLWVATGDPPTSAGHPLYQRLNLILESQGLFALLRGGGGSAEPGAGPVRAFISPRSISACSCGRSSDWDPEGTPGVQRPTPQHALPPEIGFHHALLHSPNV